MIPGILVTTSDLAKDGNLRLLRGAKACCHDPNQVSALTKLDRDKSDSPKVIDLNGHS
jgi:hypothetical protein